MIWYTAPKASKKDWLLEDWLLIAKSKKHL